ncbi:MAG: phenylalanine--tRNA ligase subunit beta [Proteobacteria bacterium]|nr:phenylalanine--tRNA ligase subunit beta [Pseudomonadota bacterium]
MKFSLSWLKTHLETDAAVQTIADTLVKMGIEVEAVETTGGSFAHVVIGHIKERVPHPDADRLGVCQVDVGEGSLRQIVCGAPNARAGLTVAVAMPGAVLPGDFKIKESKIRGQESKGMICSARELGLGTEHDGIMELATKAAPGTAFADTLGEADTIFDVSITPNRGDALCVLGIARDLAAAGLGRLIEPVTALTFEQAAKQKAAIETDGCHFFCGIEVEGVKNGQSPAWLKKRLESIGLRPINTIVDIGNFVMFDLGQPLHMYDADTLKGTLRVSTAKGGEKLNGLNGGKHTLNANDITIVDDSGVIGLAGIVGGEETSTTEATKRIYIEAAQFDRSRIALTGQAHQIHSDARARFERGINPAMTIPAALHAANLVVELCGGKIVGMTQIGTAVPAPVVIDFDPDMVNRFGGLPMQPQDVKNSLEALGFGVTEQTGGQFAVAVPPHFTQMATPEDLVEEVLRLAGYENIPAVLPAAALNRKRDSAPALRLDRIARRQMAALGYLEAITYSFISEKLARLFEGGSDDLKLANPIDAATMSDMRPSLLAGLLDAAVKNVSRAEDNLKLAEIGRTHHAGGAEVLRAAGILFGKGQRHWQGQQAMPTVFDAKADAYALLEAYGIDITRMPVDTNVPGYFHPTRSGSVRLGKDVLMTFGEIHPAVTKELGIKVPVAAFEVNLHLAAKAVGKDKPFVLSQYQSVSRDLAFVVDATTPAGELLATLRNVDKNIVRNVQLFDVYSGDKLPAGKKSIAVSLTLQADDRTLTEADITGICDKAVEAATKRFNAQLRA